MGVRCGTRLRGSTRAREAGQTTTEYAVLIASLAVLVIVALLFLALNIDNLFSETGGGTDPGSFTPPVAQCDSHYAGVCIPSPPPDLDCADLAALGIPRPVQLVGGDPHHLDEDGDGFGC